jgi:transposase
MGPISRASVRKNTTKGTWVRAHRSPHGRSSLRYASDLTDGEWRVVAALLPVPKRNGRPRHVELREIVNGILYVLETGCLWNDLPSSFPPKSTTYDYFARWRSDRTILKLHRALYAEPKD